MATGANTAPLGKLHPILAAKIGDQNSNNGTISGSKDPELKKHLEAAKRAASTIFPSSSSSSEPPKKKRRSRWNTDDGKIVISGLPTVLPANMTEEEQTFYILHLKIEEHSRMLRTGDLGIPVNPSDRSPSPEPIYNHDGKRQNTREVRMRKRLEDERHDMVQKALALKPEYKPPPDYKPPNRKFEDKVFIPQDHHPETNFVGLLIGPRGNTLKQLERDTQTKIMIRGKGATKEGKLGRAGLPQPGEDEPLHALITGTTPELVKGAVDKIKSIIQSGIDVPGNDNDLKKLQLQQLAELNGTFKPLDVLKCRNCGSTQHKTWECSEHQNITSSIVCTKCGGGGHIASDCKADLSAVTGPPVDKAKMDSEYLSLMKELGESVPDAPVSGGAAVPPPASLTGTGKPGDQQYSHQPHAAPVGMVPVMMPHPWAQPAISGAPPLMAGPPPFMMMPPAGGLMAPAPWGMAPVPGHAPLMPTPHMGMPMASESESAHSASASGSSQPVPLLATSAPSSSNAGAVPMTTPTSSSAQPGPPPGAAQPPWQQQQQPPQPQGPHPHGAPPPHPQQPPPPGVHPHPPPPSQASQAPPHASQAPPLFASQGAPVHGGHPPPHASQAQPHPGQAPPIHAQQQQPMPAHANQPAPWQHAPPPHMMYHPHAMAPHPQGGSGNGQAPPPPPDHSWPGAPPPPPAPPS